jgi:RNase P protein component
LTNVYKKKKKKCLEPQFYTVPQAGEDCATFGVSIVRSKETIRRWPRCESQRFICFIQHSYSRRRVRHHLTDAFLPKSLVIKPKPGRFKALFSKLTTINKKNGPFDLIICVSDLFKTPENEQEEEELDDLLAHQISVPVRTFAMLGSIQLPSTVRGLLETKDGVVCPNLELLGLL